MKTLTNKLTPGAIYGWRRTNRSRSRPGVTIPADIFLPYSMVRCSLPDGDGADAWQYVRATSEDEFEVEQSIVPVPETELSSGAGFTSKVDNVNEFADLSEIQLEAEDKYYEEQVQARAMPHRMAQMARTRKGRQSAAAKAKAAKAAKSGGDDPLGLAAA